MSNLNERLEQLNGQLAEWEAQSPRNQSKIDAIQAEIGRVKEQMQETEAREQKTGELLDEYNDTLNDIFDALFPADKFRVILGETDYNQLRQDYKRVHHAYHAGQIDRINADHANEIESMREKHERILAATTEEYITAFDRAEKEKEGLIQEREAWEVRAKELEQQVEDLQGDVRRLQGQNADLREKYTVLKEKLAKAEKAKEPAKTEALSNVLDEIKSRKQMDPDDLMRRFQSRQDNGPKVMSIEHGKPPELPELPFRAEVATPDNTEATVGGQFRGGQPIGVPVPQDGASGGVAEEETAGTTVTREEFEALRADVEALKRLNGMVA